MCRIAIVLALLIAAPSSGHADAHRVDRELPLSQLIVPLPRAWHWQVYGSFHADARASSGDDARLAALGAGLDVAYASDDCRWIGLAVDVRGEADRDGQSLSGSEAASVCLPLAVHLSEITLRRQRELIPRLSAAPYYQASRFGSTGAALETRMVRISTSRVDIRVGHSTLDFTWVTQTVDGEPQRTSEYDVSLGMVELSWPGRGFLGRERVLDIMRARIVGRGRSPSGSQGSADEMQPNASAAVISPVRFIGFGSSFSLDLDVGFALGTFAEVGPWIENPDGTLSENRQVHASAITPHVDIHVEWGDERRAQGIRYQHTIEPSSYRTLVAEDRLSLWLRTSGDQSTSTVRGFAALTHILSDELDVERVATGGLALSREMMAGDHFRLGLTGEVARSFYANLHGTSRIEAGWAGRVVAEIGFHAQSQR